MFEQQDKPRLFGVPCGVDFAQAIKDGLLARLDPQRPEVLARTQIYVNTSRMARTIKAAFDDGGTHFLPRIRLVTDLVNDPDFADLTPTMSGFRLRLELAQLVARFLDQKPDFAERAAIFDLADGLARLMGEMHDEGVDLAQLKALDIRDESGHWGDALDFIALVREFYDHGDEAHVLVEERLAQIVGALEEKWATHPPHDPILVVGSTGSRGTTARLMAAVARLPLGAVVQPGVDFDLPQDVWDTIARDGLGDHPQERVIRCATRLGLARADVRPFSDTVVPENTARNALLSLALRPAPVTDQWMRDGPAFGREAEACADLTLINAPDPRREANAIALVLKKAAQDGKRAALISPDRDLARQVSAALDRWSIDPEDSAGVPLAQTPPGRLLRHVVDLMGRPIRTEKLLVALKHPLVAMGGEALTDSPAGGRGFHVLWMRQLEARLRKKGVMFPDRAALEDWARSEHTSGLDAQARLVWVDWIVGLMTPASAVGTQSLSAHLALVEQLAERLVAGALDGDREALWQGIDGREARRIMDEFILEAPHGGVLDVVEFGALFRNMLAPAMARDPAPKHPDILIWGTLDARSIQADLVVLGSAIDGVWPRLPAPDPWFSRGMRKEAGLLSPEQMVGLSAHDFQQGFGAREVVITRAIRDAEAETIPSRWLSRLMGLLGGMSEEGRAQLAAMTRRGEKWIALANALDRPAAQDAIAPAVRPSPRPPLSARPTQLSVTQIERLISDPYTIYAEKILRLRKLPPISRGIDYRERGTALHKVMELFVKHMPPNEGAAAAQARLMQISEQVFAQAASTQVEARVWLARMHRIAARLVVHEQARFAQSSARHLECYGKMELPALGFTVTGKADRIDQRSDGDFVLYDYKAGRIPTSNEAQVYKVQLLVEAVMLEAASFEGLPLGSAHSVSYLSLDKALGEMRIELDRDAINKTQIRLKKLIDTYRNPDQGYTARRVPKFAFDESDYRLLSRYEEWSDSDDAIGLDVGDVERGT